MEKIVQAHDDRSVAKHSSVKYTILHFSFSGYTFLAKAKLHSVDAN